MFDSLLSRHLFVHHNYFQWNLERLNTLIQCNQSINLLSNKQFALKNVAMKSSPLIKFHLRQEAGKNSGPCNSAYCNLTRYLKNFNKKDQRRTAETQ